MTEQQIVKRYVEEEGAAVLWVTPGFVGRTAPYAALTLGFGGVLLVIKRYLRIRPTKPDMDTATLERLTKNMGDFE
jgi:hypothetical protein